MKPDPKQLTLRSAADALAAGTFTAVELAEALLDRVLSQQDCFSLAQLAVNGDDLLAIGIPRGRAVGLLLQRLLDAVVDGTVSNERDALVQYAQYFSSEAKTN